MDIRTLQYFLAVAREESITGAAEFLHMTQPPLSRQLKDLEEELGVQLLIRGSRRITLTEEGMILRKRAEELVDLFNKTRKEVSSSHETIAGDIYIGGGETDAVCMIARVAKKLQEKHPNVHYHLTSGDAEEVLERLDKGLVDFGIVVDPVNISKYEYLKLPDDDIFGVLMHKESPLAEKEYVCAEDLRDKPLIVSRQTLMSSEMAKWMGADLSSLNVVGTYTLLYNASRMVSEGFGYAICLDKLINTEKSELCFRPLYPEQSVGLNIVWKRYQVFSKAAEKFLEELHRFLSTT